MGKMEHYEVGKKQNYRLLHSFYIVLQNFGNGCSMICDFSILETKKKKLESLRPLPPETMASFRQHFITDFTYNSNAIEGNTLTLIETSIVINEGITVGGKTLREHLEVINHKEAYLYIEDLVKQNSDLSERVIKDIHYLVLNHNKEYAGQYRKVPVMITGSDFLPVQPYLIGKAMEDLLCKYVNEWKDGHLIDRIAKFHLEFESIHPFIDGNGRTGRLLINLELLKNGYLPISVKFENRTKYYSAFAEYHTAKSHVVLNEIIYEELNKQLDRMIHLAESIENSNVEN